jgi:hypothetical protein
MKTVRASELVPVDGPSFEYLEEYGRETGKQHKPITARAHKGTQRPLYDWRVHCVCHWFSGDWDRLDRAIEKFTDHVTHELRRLLKEANAAFDECTGEYAKDLVRGEKWRAHDPRP